MVDYISLDYMMYHSNWVHIYMWYHQLNMHHEYMYHMFDSYNLYLSIPILYQSHIDEPVSMHEISNRDETNYDVLPIDMYMYKLMYMYHDHSHQDIQV